MDTSFSVDDEIAKLRNELHAFIEQWQSGGKDRGIIERLIDHRERYVRVLREGPSGFGPLPSGCTGTSDMAVLRRQHDGFAARRAKLLEPYRKAVIKAEVAANIPDALLPGPPRFLPTLWSLEEEQHGRAHPWWVRRPAGPSLSADWYAYLLYDWAVSLGASASPVLQACFDAYVAGRIPTGIDGDAVVVFSASPAIIAKTTGAH